MSEFRCAICILGEPEDVMSAVTLYKGTAYCADHLRVMAEVEKRLGEKLIEKGGLADLAAQIDGPVCMGEGPSDKPEQAG